MRKPIPDLFIIPFIHLLYRPRTLLIICPIALLTIPPFPNLKILFIMKWVNGMLPMTGW